MALVGSGAIDADGADEEGAAGSDDETNTGLAEGLAAFGAVSVFDFAAGEGWGEADDEGGVEAGVVAVHGLGEDVENEGVTIETSFVGDLVEGGGQVGG